MIRWEICSILITRSALFSLGLLFIEVTHMFLLNWRSVFEQPLKWRIIIWISDVGLGWIRRWYQGSLWLNASNNNDRVKKEVSKDEEMLKLVVAITSDLDCFPDAIAVYNKLKDSLSVVDGVPMYGRRVIIPKCLRQDVLQCLHSAHQCPVRMNDRAKHSVYWPGIMSEK